MDILTRQWVALCLKDLEGKKDKLQRDRTLFDRTSFSLNLPFPSSAPQWKVLRFIHPRALSWDLSLILHLPTHGIPCHHHHFLPPLHQLRTRYHCLTLGPVTASSPSCFDCSPAAPVHPLCACFDSAIGNCLQCMNKFSFLSSWVTICLRTMKEIPPGPWGSGEI